MFPGQVFRCALQTRPLHSAPTPKRIPPRETKINARLSVRGVMTTVQTSINVFGSTRCPHTLSLCCVLVLCPCACVLVLCPCLVSLSCVLVLCPCPCLVYLSCVLVLCPCLESLPGGVKMCLVVHDVISRDTGPGDKPCLVVHDATSHDDGHKEC